MRLYRGAIFVFAVLFVAIGVALIVATAIRGGALGYLLGALFLAVGSGRLYILTRGPRL